jgi:hypothetical protein
MLRTTAALPMATQDMHSLLGAVLRWKRIALTLLLSGVLGCLPIRGHAAGLDCPELGPGSVPNLLTDLQVKLIASADSADLANEINDLVNSYKF